MEIFTIVVYKIIYAQCIFVSYVLGIFDSFLVQTFQKNIQNINLLIDYYVWAQD